MWLRVISALAVICTVCVGLQDPLVTTDKGRLRGQVIYTFGGKRIHSFRGIPYAKPPVGELRFKNPTSADPWQEIRSAKTDGSRCIQKDLLFPKKGIVGSEDCLYLNVYSPRLPASGSGDSPRNPVLVYVHGGGWFSGHGGLNLYGPQYLLDQDVVLVTLNYRLGVLGFLNTGDVSSPGNYGLKDQALALKWVQANIEAFGGDPTSVTIFGQSAGGASVHYHLLSHMSRGLFHRAVSLSGTAFAPWAFTEHTGKTARRLAKVLDCPETPSSQLVVCLRTKNPEAFVNALETLSEWASIDPMFAFAPSVEAPHGAQPFLPASPVALMRESERFFDDQIPWMVGFTAEDGAIKTAMVFSDASLVADLNSDYDRVAPFTLNLQDSTPDPVDAARKVRAYYFGEQPIDKTTIAKLTELYTDRHFLVPLVHSVQSKRAIGSERPIYLYEFSYRGRHSITSTLHPGSDDIDYGASHLDELQYIFAMPDLFPSVPKDLDDPDFKMMKFMVDLLLQFASTGSPTVKTDEDLKRELMNATGPAKFVWHKIDGDDIDFADLNVDRPSMKGPIRPKNIKFWESLDLQEHGRPLVAPVHTEL